VGLSLKKDRRKVNKKRKILFKYKKEKEEACYKKQREASAQNNLY